MQGINLIFGVFCIQSLTTSHEALWSDERLSAVVYLSAVSMHSKGALANPSDSASSRNENRRGCCKSHFLHSKRITNELEKSCAQVVKFPDTQKAKIPGLTGETEVFNIQRIISFSSRGICCQMSTWFWLCKSLQTFSWFHLIVHLCSRILRHLFTFGCIVSPFPLLPALWKAMGSLWFLVYNEEADKDTSQNWVLDVILTHSKGQFLPLNSS